MLVTLPLLVGVGPALAQAPDARQVAPWLDLPATWWRMADSGRVIAKPNDLAPGDSFTLWVEPPAMSGEELLAAYERTIHQVGTWTPVHPASDYRFDSGWVFHVGTGVVRRGSETYTAVVAVGRKDGYLARFWALADRDDTYNRYQGAVMVGISSAQDVDLASLSAPVAGALAIPPPGVAAGVGATPGIAPPLEGAPAPVALDSAFGIGVTGVYLGLERGVRAHAGAGYAGATELATSVDDYTEVDVFFPDGSYRRGLPERGLASDLNWDRATFGSKWGTWALHGDRIVTRRQSYVTTYFVRGDVLQSERDRPWRKLPPMADARVEGTFARPNAREPDAPRLLLHADGTYQDRGDMLRTLGTAFNLVVPDGETGVARWSDAEARHWMRAGGGTYTLRAYTLTLRDRDGRVWQFAAYIPPAEAFPRPRYLVVNETELIRE